MTPERWQRIGEIISAVLERDVAQRVSFLQQACEGDEQLRREVENLLSAHENARNFLERPSVKSPPGQSSRLTEEAAPTEPAGVKALSETDSGLGAIALDRGMALGR